MLESRSHRNHTILEMGAAIKQNRLSFFAAWSPLAKRLGRQTSYVCFHFEHTFVRKGVNFYLVALSAMAFTFTPCPAQDDLFPHRQTVTSAVDASGVPHLTPPARQLAEQLKIVESMRALTIQQQEYQRSGDAKTLLEVIRLRQILMMATQHAAVEVEEALATIDGELTSTNLLLAYASSRTDRSIMLNNVATFVGSGALGVIDSSTGLKLGVPTPQIFGIIGNSIAAGLPLAGLRRHEYKNPRRSQAEVNMLAPIFGRPYPGESYDPLVWNYLDSVPAEPGSSQTRRQMLLQRWQKFRNVATTGPSQGQIEALIGTPKQNDMISVQLLKTRAELLFDLRSVVQQMYRDISELNTAIMAL